MASFRALPLWVLMSFVLALAAGTARADDADEDADGDEKGLALATKDQAKPLIDALKKAKKPKDIMPALDAFAGLTHKDFRKPLLKLMTNKDDAVALRATEMLEERRCDPDEPDEIDEKLLKSMWKEGIKSKSNEKRYVVRAVVYRAHARAGLELDKSQYKELERDWRWMFGQPQAHFADAVIVLCEYCEIAKDRRHCRQLAEQLDEPAAKNPNDPNNPPAEWWERRWNMWQPVKPAVVAALLAITGQEFDQTEAALTWLKENGFE